MLVKKKKEKKERKKKNEKKESDFNIAYFLGIVAVCMYGEYSTASTVHSCDHTIDRYLPGL